VAHNHVLRYFQRKRRDVSFLGSELLAAIAEEAVRQNDIWAERRQALNLCVEQLSSVDRELIERRFQPNTTSRSLAGEIGRSESAISRALNRICIALLGCIQRRMNRNQEGPRS
jgi:RNA polymerase sigma-70 factor (ECF subfamily)